MNRKPPCPKCGSREVIPIVYGMPGPELLRKSAEGRVALGGCVVSPENPTVECQTCGASWRDPAADGLSAQLQD